MSDTLKLNPQTGQIAVQQPDGQWHVYDKGTYKTNPMNGQIAIPKFSQDGKASYELHTAPDVVNKLYQPEALGPGLGGPGSTSQSGSNIGGGEAALRGLDQGLTYGLSDEIGAEAGAGVRSMMGDQSAIDPNHPVTGGMSGGFSAAYQNLIKDERQKLAQAGESHPQLYKGTKFVSSFVPFLASMPASIGQAARMGAGQGGMLAFGNADTQDPRQALKQTAFGSGGGALLGAASQAVFPAIMADTTPSGIAYRALDETANASGRDGIGGIQVRPSAAPAELDPAMADLLRTAASKNGAASAAAIPAAQARLANVNQAIIGEVGNRLSPEDAAAAQLRIVQEGQTANHAAYQTAHANPTILGFGPHITTRPSFNEALTAVRARAADEYPPRTVDPTNLSALDTDLIDRSLQRAQNAATESHGNVTQEALNSQARIPTRGEVANHVRTMADIAYPELTTARAAAATNFARETALETSRTWLRPGVSPEQVHTEFNAMNPEQQQVALAGVATDLRNMLNTKTARANLGAVFEKIGLAEKLGHLGVPTQTIEQMVRGGGGARAVLDALQGGSMTARNLAGAKALQSTLSGIKSGDLTAAAVLRSKTAAVGLPFMRALGARSERQGAGLLVDALSSLGPDGLANIYNNAPQTWGGLLSQPGAYGGSLLGQQYGK